MKVNIAIPDLKVLREPIKNAGRSEADSSLVVLQSELTAQCLRYVDYSLARGTCGDERRRTGLLSGKVAVEMRPSIFGGPDIYGLAIGELTGIFDEKKASGEDRLRAAKRLLNNAGIRSGGHVECAANAMFNAWMTTIKKQPNTIKSYAKKELGIHYDEAIMDEVIQNAGVCTDSGIYDEWNEDVLVRVLGNEAGEAMEVLADVLHEGCVVVRNKVPDTTIDQTALYDLSVLGRGTFDVDDYYAELIENIIISASDNEHLTKLARHAREAIIAAIAGAVPNTLLYECVLKPQKISNVKDHHSLSSLTTCNYTSKRLF